MGAEVPGGRSLLQHRRGRTLVEGREIDRGLTAQGYCPKIKCGDRGKEDALILKDFDCGSAGGRGKSHRLRRQSAAEAHSQGRGSWCSGGGGVVAKPTSTTHSPPEGTTVAQALVGVKSAALGPLMVMAPGVRLASPKLLS